jgi:hypothetical protein
MWDFSVFFKDDEISKKFKDVVQYKELLSSISGYYDFLY